MSGFQQVLIGGYPSGGLTQDRKPALLANEAYSDLDNAYVWRERTKKRDGEVPMGRLSRVFSDGRAGDSHGLLARLATPRLEPDAERSAVSNTV